MRQRAKKKVQQVAMICVAIVLNLKRGIFTRLFRPRAPRAPQR